MLVAAAAAAAAGCAGDDGTQRDHSAQPRQHTNASGNGHHASAGASRPNEGGAPGLFRQPRPGAPSNKPKRFRGGAPKRMGA